MRVITKDTKGRTQHSDAYSAKTERANLLAARNANLPAKTPFSKLGTAPEGYSLLAPFGWLFASLVTVLVLALLLALSPLILLCTGLRACYFARIKYRRTPSSLRVGIIGGGWSGCQILQRLKELGVQDVQCFERNDDVGGTFHPALAYHSLEIHSAMWITSFKDFPYSRNQDQQDGKVRADTVLDYIKSFVDHHNLRPHYQMRTKVVKVAYSSADRTGTLTLQDTRTDERREVGPFDLVIFASQASRGNIPNVPNTGFTGKSIHTIDFKTEVYEDIIRKQQRVVVVGGNKSAVDMVLNFERAAYAPYTWLYRRPYLFLKYEAVYHNRSVMNTLRGISTVVAFLLLVPCKSLAGLVMWGSGAATTFGRWHNDWNAFHMGNLCPKQRAGLAAARKHEMIGNPVELSKDGVKLEDGRTIGCDVIVWGTGYRTGLEDLELEKDGQPFHFDPDMKLFNHLFVPRFPILVSAVSLWTTGGPVRAVNCAELGVYHLCVRKPMTEEAMEADARWNFSFNSAARSFLFDNRRAAMREFVVMHIDLILRGIVSVEDLLSHLIGVFVTSGQSPVRFNILPSGAGR